MRPRKIDYVVFDLGGVLVRLGGVPWLREFARAKDDDVTMERWLLSSWVRSFETGECGAEDFAVGLVSDWGLEMGPEAFLEKFKVFPERLFEGALELTREARAWRPVACLSNTNALHWDRISGFGLGTAFDSTFLSHETRLVKPDREAFDHVVDKLGVPAEHIVFLDDNLINVSAAQAVGLAAFHVHGPEEARSVLLGLGMPGQPLGTREGAEGLDAVSG